jgi:hypothetical protein
MITAIPLRTVQFRDQWFRQLSLPMQTWVRQQADQIVRQGSFARWEEMQLTAVIQQKFSRISSTGFTDVALSKSILEFLVLTDAIAAYEEKLNSAGDDAQLANIDLQNMLQKQQQTLQLLSNVSKTLADTALAIIRKIG